jgi:hypothetical protein
MPVDIRLDAEAGIVYTTIEGLYTAGELLAAFEVLFDNPDFRPGLKGIADLRKAETYPPATDVMRIARYLIEHEEKIGKSRTAVLISGDVSFGTTRMFQAYADDSIGIETRIFYEMEEARRWLGLDD